MCIFAVRSLGGEQGPFLRDFPCSQRTFNGPNLSTLLLDRLERWDSWEGIVGAAKKERFGLVVHRSVVDLVAIKLESSNLRRVMSNQRSGRQGGMDISERVLDSFAASDG